MSLHPDCRGFAQEEPESYSQQVDRLTAELASVKNELGIYHELLGAINLQSRQYSKEEALVIYNKPFDLIRRLEEENEMLQKTTKGLAEIIKNNGSVDAKETPSVIVYISNLLEENEMLRKVVDGLPSVSEIQQMIFDYEYVEDDRCSEFIRLAKAITARINSGKEGE